ncbi:hypothetical protein KBC31_03390 [Candidatus Saccharibacteria bacterium]|jgi:hypothetical protein|nr:hypothetical protein [Candidatus Saccharibacteria bacterium]
MADQQQQQPNMDSYGRPVVYTPPPEKKPYKAIVIIISVIVLVIVLIIAGLFASGVFDKQEEQQLQKQEATKADQDVNKQKIKEAEGNGKGTINDGLLTMPEINVTMKIPEELKDIRYNYVFKQGELLEFSSRGLIENELEMSGSTAVCETSANPLGTAQVLRPDDAGYDFARKDEYTQLSDGRRLRFIRSPNSDCLDKFGEGTDLLLTSVQDALKTSESQRIN